MSGNLFAIIGAAIYPIQGFGYRFNYFHAYRKNTDKICKQNLNSNFKNI
jgi:hypothetical protein